MSSKLIMTAGSVPDTPNTGKKSAYFDSADGYFKFVDDAGVVHRVVDGLPTRSFTMLGHQRTTNNASSAQSQRGIITPVHLPLGAVFQKIAYRVGTVAGASPTSCFAIYPYNGGAYLWNADGLDLAPAAGGTGTKQYDFGAKVYLAPGKYLFYEGIKDATMALHRVTATGFEAFERSHQGLSTADGSVAPATVSVSGLSLSIQNMSNLLACMFYDEDDE